MSTNEMQFLFSRASVKRNFLSFFLVVSAFSAFGEDKNLAATNQFSSVSYTLGGILSAQQSNSSNGLLEKVATYQFTTSAQGNRYTIDTVKLTPLSFSPALSRYAGKEIMRVRLFYDSTNLIIIYGDNSVVGRSTPVVVQASDYPQGGVTPAHRALWFASASYHCLDNMIQSKWAPLFYVMGQYPSETCSFDLHHMPENSNFLGSLKASVRLSSDQLKSLQQREKPIVSKRPAPVSHVVADYHIVSTTNYKNGTFPLTSRFNIYQFKSTNVADTPWLETSYHVHVTNVTRNQDYPLTEPFIGVAHVSDQRELTVIGDSVVYDLTNQYYASVDSSVYTIARSNAAAKVNRMRRYQP